MKQLLLFLWLSFFVYCDGQNGESSDDVGGDGSTSSDTQADGEIPPVECKTPGPLGSGPYFTDVTYKYNIAFDQLNVLGIRISSADLDNDGYPDLVVHRVDWNVRDKLSEDPQVRYKRILLNRPDPNNPGNRIFEDVTDTSGFTQTRDGQLGRSAQLAVFADVDNNGTVDVFSGTYVDKSKADPGDRSEILLNDGAASFTLATPSDTSPAASQKWTTTSATFLDYDKDGIIDLFVGFWYKSYGYSYEGTQNRLYKGVGDGTFIDVTDAVGLTTQPGGFEQGVNHRPTYGVTSCDIDGDGYSDLVVSAYGRQWNMLWKNQAGVSFQNIAPTVGFDADTLVDYTDNEMYKCYCKANPSECSAGNPRMSCSSTAWTPGSDDQPWRLGGNTFTTVCGDLNNDGRLDLFNAEIRHWWAGQSADPSQILLNQATSENDLGWSLVRWDNSASGIARKWTAVDWNEGDITAGFFDFDNDGLLDIYLSSSAYPNCRGYLFHQLPDGTFEEIAEMAGGGHPQASGLALIDLDNDGDLDIVVGSGTGSGLTDWETNEVHIYHNNVGSLSNWIRVKLEGEGLGGSNRSGIGAKVIITTGSRVQVREISGGYGHFGIHNGLEAHFGLGEACTVDKLEIIWPNSQGTVSTFTNVQANYRILIREGEETVNYLR